MLHRIVWLSNKLGPKEEWKLRCLINPYLNRKWEKKPTVDGFIGGGVNNRIEYPALPNEDNKNQPPTPQAEVTLVIKDLIIRYIPFAPRLNEQDNTDPPTQ